MGRIEQVIDTAIPIITQALIDNGITDPIQVYQGWPTATELSDILNQGHGQVTLFPLAGGRRLKPYGFGHIYETITPVTMAATVVSNVITLSGAPTAGLNVFAYVNDSVPNCGVVAGDTLAVIATRLTTQINLVPGITAVAAGAVITVTGAYALKASVLGTGTQSQEVIRWEQRVQLSIWAPTPAYRAQLVDAIVPVIGNDADPFLDLGDGSSALFSFAGAPQYIDEAQLTKNVYVAHFIYTAAYPILQTFQAYQVGETTVALTDPDLNLSLTVNQGM